MSEGRWESLFGGAMWWTDDTGELWYARTPRGGMVNPAPAGFVAEAKQELLRLIVDVQQNRNRPEDLT